MASQRNLSGAASSDSRCVSGSGEHSALSSPRGLARPGSAGPAQENGTSGEQPRLSVSLHPHARLVCQLSSPERAACTRRSGNGRVQSWWRCG